MARKQLLTRDELLKPITGCRCGKCGNTDCTIYPDPLPTGTFVCSNCNPGMASLAKWMAEHR